MKESIAIILLLVLLMGRVPIGIALGIAGVVGLSLVGNFKIAVLYLGSIPYQTTSSWILVCFPLFILMGMFASAAGISRDAYHIANKWFGSIRGGLAMSTVAGCAAFAATTGSSMATSVVMGKIALPEMRKYGYDDALNTGCIAASGLLGIMIPPSIIFMIYGVAAEQSIGKLLIAGVFPGILTAILYIAGIYVLLRFKPSLAPYQVTDRVSWKERIASLRYFWSVLLLFLTVIGGIYLGVFTPTEWAAFGVLVTLFFLLFSKQTKGIKAKTVAIRTGLEEAAKITAMLFLIMIGSTIFTTFINMAEIPQTVAHFFAGLQVPPIVLLIMILLLFIPLGMFIDAISMILITVPILIPVVLQAGFSGIWFGVLVTVMAEIASITPPVAMNVFAVKGIAPEVPIETIYKGIMPFLIVQFIILALLIAFPQISLFLPSRMM